MASLSEELKIVISGDPKKFNKALDEALASTKRLEASASATAKVSAAAFAALTGTVVGLVAAFREQEIQEQKTAAILKAQGNAASVTAQQVYDMASALQRVTIFGDEVILEAQNMLLGLTKLSKDGFERASLAALDLATFMGIDAKSAAQQLGKALANPAEGLSALSRAGIKFSKDQERMITALSETGRVADAQNMILQILEGRIGGLAKAGAQGSGKLIQLKDVIGDIAEEIGRNLVPTLAKGAEIILPFARALSENKEFAKTSATLLLVGAAVTGLVAVLATSTVAIIKWNALMKASELTVLALGFSIRGALITTGLGLLAVVIVDLAVNWNKRIAQMSSAFYAFVETVVKGGALMQDVIYNTLTGNLSKAGDALKSLGSLGTVFADAYTAKMKSAMAESDAATKESTESSTKTLADGNERKITNHIAYLETMKKLNEEYKNLNNEAQLSANEQELITDAEHRNALVEQANEFRKAQLESRVDDATIDAEQELAFQTQMQEMRNESRAAELNAHRAAQLERAQVQQKADLQFLKDREKFGVTYAKINKVINSEYVQGAASAASDLVALQQSTNSTLKAIGKAAAIADITIKTAQAAMNIYNGFATIPIVGQALGIAGAAAAVAFGAERIRQVTAAAEGGIMTGGIPGKDSIATMTMPGELVTPTKNFDEVVNAVAQQRLAEQGLAGGGQQQVEVMIGFTDDAFRIIEQKLDERRVILRT